MMSLLGETRHPVNYMMHIEIMARSDNMTNEKVDGTGLEYAYRYRQVITLDA